MAELHASSLPAGPGPAWSVAGLLLALTDALGARFGAVTVQGELSGYSRASSGHSYFTLKDAEGAAAALRCVMFRRVAGMLDFAPADGQRVELRGRLTLYEPRGDLQFVVEAMRRQGAGSLYEEFQRLRARLEAAGLFDPTRRRAIAAHPRAVGIVTSLGAAALHDVLTALARRAPHVRVIVYPCLVQGAEAPATIVRALQTATQRAEVDTLLLVRGGGSIEDLWAFNDERTVRAVAGSPIPVVCGVGHETDVTLCDLAADLRAPTPTAAAELAAPLRLEALQRLQAWQDRLGQVAQRQIDRQAQRLDLLSRRAGQPGVRLLAQEHRLSSLEDRLRVTVQARCRLATAPLQGQARRLTLALRQGVRQRQAALDSLTLRLQASHPDQVLRRGYAWVATPSGTPALGVDALAPGMPIDVIFHDGQVSALVREIRARGTAERPDDAGRLA